MTHTVYFVFVIFAIIAGSAFADSCQTLCISRTSTDGNRLTAYLSYGGAPLRDSLVNVALNNVSSATVLTDSSGGFALYAPFHLGRNVLSFQYEGSKATRSLYYFGSLSGLALIPIGAAFYAALRRSSRFASANSDVTLSYAPDSSVLGAGISRELVCGIAARMRGSNAYAFKGLPPSVDEVSDCVKELTGAASAPYVRAAAARACLDAYYGVLCIGTLPYREVVAKKLYESAINCGAYSAIGSKSIRGFFKRNGIVPFMDYAAAPAALRTSKLSIAVLGMEGSALRALSLRASRSSSFLLFNELNGLVDVVKC